MFGPTDELLPTRDALPLPRTSFIGREHELGQVSALLACNEARLVTLIGPGGVGKTRIAKRALEAVDSSKRFIALADVREPSLVLPTIAAAMSIRPDRRPSLDQLVSVLRQGEHVLVLDNFEHVLPAAAFLDDLLDLCPNLKLLVTSRTMLGIPGEHMVDVRPFWLPGAEGTSTTHHLEALNLDACRLFAERTQLLDPEFRLTPQNVDMVIDICQQLDGLPLAIELAASWTSVFTLQTLLTQLNHRLTLPGDAKSWAHPRHRSLHDTIAWSHALLDDSAQQVFRRLSVFRGGCTLDAMRAVCSNDDRDILPVLRTLIANSLVRRFSSPDGETRYTMLETVREYAAQRLQESGESDVVSTRHANWFLSLVERSELFWDTPQRDVQLDVLDAELGNVHAALEWAISQNQAAIAIAFCGALLPVWQFRFHSGAGREWVRRSLALETPVSAASVRKAVYCAGTLAYMHGDLVDAETHFAVAEANYRDADEPGMTGRIELAIGRMAWDSNDLVTARSLFEAARQRFELTGDQSGLALSLHYLGLVAFKDDRLDEAAFSLQDALLKWRSLGFTWELAQCIPGHLADVARARGDLTAAMSLYQDCLRLNWDRKDTENVSWSLAGLAMIALNDGNADHAAALMALADRCEALTGAPLTPHIRLDHDLAMDAIVQAVGPARFAEIGQEVLGANLADSIVNALDMVRTESLTHSSSSRTESLTPREHDVLRMLAGGHSNQEIADALHVSVGTVKVHVSHILAKLNVRSRAAATDYAHRHKLTRT